MNTLSGKLMNKTEYYNILIDILSTGEALTKCEKFFSSDKHNIIFFLNAHCFNLAQKNQTYQNALNTADLLLNDGIGIKLGGKLTGIQVKDNLNGTDLIPKILTVAKNLNKNVYLLGGEEGIARVVQQKLEGQIPGISIVGVHNGFFSFDNDEDIVSDIVENKTDLLIVGMGVPRQELWLMKNKEKLKGVKISIAGGAVLDFLSGNVLRAPQLMRKTGTEWVFRIYQEPKRLFHRYFVGIPLFFLNLIKIKKD